MTKPPSKQTPYAVKYAKYHRAGYRYSVPVLPYQRMLQALCAIGYSRKDLAALMGCSHQHIGNFTLGKYTRCRLEDARKIKALYDKLSVQPLHTTNSRRVRAWAKKHNWAPPMAWNNIFDPHERPKGVIWPTAKCSVCGDDKRPMRRGFCPKHYNSHYYRKVLAK